MPYPEINSVTLNPILSLFSESFRRILAFLKCYQSNFFNERGYEEYLLI